MSYIGISSRPTTDGSDTNYTIPVVQQVIDFMNQKNLNLYRMAFHLGVNDALRDSLVRYYLDHCSHDIVLNYYHDQFGTAITAAEVQASITKALQIMPNFQNDQERIILEWSNERTGTAENMVIWNQQFIDAIRAQGYNCRIVFNRWYNQDYNILKNINDPLGQFYHGEHAYMNTSPVAWLEQKLQVAIDLGLKILVTECGAHTLEYPQFTQTLVNDLNGYLARTYAKGVANCVWTLHGIRDFTAASATNYTVLGLAFPNLPPPPVYFNVVLTSTVGGSTTPAPGTYQVAENTVFQATATPAQGYILDHWLYNGASTTSDSISFSVTQNTTLQAIFRQETTPPPVKSGAASVGGLEILGYEAMLPAPVVRVLWRMRQKAIRKEVHKKLHPLV